MAAFFISLVSKFYFMCDKVKYNNVVHAKNMRNRLNKQKGYNLKRAYKCKDCGK